MLPETETVYRSLCISGHLQWQTALVRWMDILQGMVLIIKDSHVAPFTSKRSSSKECLEWISTVV